MTLRGNSPTKDSASVAGGAVVVIGNFDGVHLGHQRLFQLAASLRRPGQVVAALTFAPHPAVVLAPQRAPKLITTEARKLDLLGQLGVDVVRLQPFDATFAGRSPEEFVDLILIEGLHAKAIVVGYDFTFGKNRSGTTSLLKTLGAARGLTIEVVDPVSVAGVVASSTEVRRLVAAGQTEDARGLLGRAPDVEGVVVAGAQRGRVLGYPTANLRPETELGPATGIYAGWALRQGQAPVAAAISVGTNPTFGAGAPVTIEAYLLDFDEDLYNQPLRIYFGRRLRGEQKFDSVTALVDQIRNDVEQTRAFCAAYSPFEADGPR